MSDIALHDVMAHLDDFSYEEKKTLFEVLKKALKRKPKKIRLARGNNKEPVHTKTLMGILKGSTVTLEEARDERLARQ